MEYGHQGKLKNCLKTLILMIGDKQSGVPKTGGLGIISQESE
jgi:hypothetical protein